MCTKNVEFVCLLVISVLCCVCSKDPSRLLLTVNNVSLLNPYSSPMITSRGSVVQLECLSSDNEAVTILHPNRSILSTSSQKYTKYRMRRMTCRDQGQYRCNSSRTSQSIDIGLNKCPPQFCQGQKSFRQITAEVGDTKTFSICVVTFNPNALTVLINNVNIYKNNNSDKYHLSVKPKRKSTFTYLLNVTIKNITSEDIGYHIFHIKANHLDVMKYYLFIKYNEAHILCSSRGNNLLIARDKSTIQYISPSRASQEIPELFTGQHRYKKSNNRNWTSLRLNIYSLTKRCDIYTCKKFDILIHKRTTKVNVLYKNCPPFQVGETKMKLDKKLNKVQFDLKFISYQNISNTVYLNNKALQVNTTNNSSDVALLRKTSGRSYQCSLILSNWTRNSLKKLNFKIHDMQNKILKMKLLPKRKTQVSWKKMIQFCQKNKTAKFEFNIPNKLKKIMVNGQEIFNNQTSKWYYELKLNTTLTLVMNNVTSDDCRKYRVRIITLKGRRIRKRNVLLRLKKLKEKRLLVNGVWTRQRLLIVKENSPITLACKWAGFEIHEISLSRATSGELLDKTGKFRLRHKVNNFTCSSMDTYICRIQPNISGNNSLIVKTDVALENCPPRACSEDDKTLMIHSTPAIINICILALNPQRWKPFIEGENVSLSPGGELNHTWNQMNKSSIHFSLTVYIGRQLPLDDGNLWLKLGENIIAQLEVTKENVRSRDKTLLFIVTACILALVVLTTLASYTWKKKGTLILGEISQSIKWNWMREKLTYLKGMKFRGRIMNTESTATSSVRPRKLQCKNAYDDNSQSHLDFTRQKTSNIDTPVNSIYANEAMEHQSVDEPRSRKINTSNSRTAKLYMNQRQTHKRTKLSKPGLRHAYENVKILKTMGSEDIQWADTCHKDDDSRQKASTSSDVGYANSFTQKVKTNNVLRGERFIVGNNIVENEESCVIQENTVNDQNGSYRNDEGLLYVTLSHDFVRGRVDQQCHIKRIKNKSPMKDQHVIYATIDLTKTKHLAKVARK